MKGIDSEIFSNNNRILFKNCNEMRYVDILHNRPVNDSFRGS